MTIKPKTAAPHPSDLKENVLKNFLLAQGFKVWPNMRTFSEYIDGTLRSTVSYSSYSFGGKENFAQMLQKQKYKNIALFGARNGIIIYSRW